MRSVSDAFLLTLAEVTAGLIGLFLVGVIFFVESGFRRLTSSREVFESYIRASTRIVLVLYAIPLTLSLTLPVLSLDWNRALFIFLSVILVAANVTTAIGVRPVNRAIHSTSLFLHEIVGSIGVAVLIALPWITGGLTPERDDLAPAMLISLGVGFLSTCILVLTLFDIARFEQTHRPGPASEENEEEPAAQ
jgi:hypothetical protein